MKIKELISDIKSNVKGSYITDESDFMINITTERIDYKINFQIEYYDNNEFCCIQYWFTDDNDDDISEIFIINSLDELENMYHECTDYTKVYNKAVSKAQALREFCDENNLNFNKIVEL